MCKEKDESIGRIPSECSELAQTHCKSKHDRVADVVHWNLCHKHGLQYEYYRSEHSVMENDEVKILRNFNVETHHVIVHT